MSFLDSQQQDAEEQGPPQAAGPPGGAPGAPGGAPGAPPGGGPVLAALANRQNRAQISTPGPGDAAQSMTMLMQAMGMMNQALPGLMGHPAYQDVLRALQRINRHISQGGAPTVGVQRTQLQDLMQNLSKNALLSSIIGKMQPRQGAGPGQPAGAAPAPQPPMPSTPLPGA